MSTRHPDARRRPFLIGRGVAARRFVAAAHKWSRETSNFERLHIAVLLGTYADALAAEFNAALPDIPPW